MNPINTNQTTTISGSIKEILYGLVIIVCIYVAFIFIELLVKYSNRITVNKTQLLPNTYSIEDKQRQIYQNPNAQGAIPIHLSNNERSGIEFSYSFYMNLNASSFRQEEGLLHLFHKGYSSQFPLLAPGVYIHSNRNTLRVYMNTYKTWNNYMDVENIPLSKWVHVVIVCKENALEIFINGNLAKKLSFDGYIPYQNFQDIYCFSQRRIALRQSTTASVDESGFNVWGTAKGYLSRLNYFSYALCYSEIQELMNEGPSPKMDSATTTNNIPPYLADDWWTNQ